WATERLKEYIVKGFSLDDERLSHPGGVDYFDELLDRIRSIRASEKRFYQKIRDIYTLSADYDQKHPMTQEFFKTVQNKLLYAVTGSTAAEIIHTRANASHPNMGLMTWKGARRGKQLTKHDVEIAKNYLNHEEIKDLELLVSQYLDFAERQARQRKVMYMADWKVKLDAFLKLNEEQILTNAGKISAEIAKELALSEYAKFEAFRKKEELSYSEKELNNALSNLIQKRTPAQEQE
ncbi:MAG: virulence RhuM family protein, partial [Chlamydiia bacterium]|nr:virulence RhuM family protein [Chlamydiia bacterium]